jgi:translation initiation factor 1
MSKKKDRLPVNPIDDFGSNPFASLGSEGLLSMSPESKKVNRPQKKLELEQLGTGERIEVRREKSGRGGKTVTTIRGFPANITKEDVNRMIKGLKSRLGTGGGWQGDQIEIQGDKREDVVEWLAAMGFKPVLAGG